MAGTDSSTFKLEADVGPFVKAIKTANSALKAFDAESKLATAQYKASGDAETYMTNQTRILNQQIEAQKEIVKQAEEGMKMLETAGKENTREYNQLNEALAKAKTELINLRSAANGASEEMEQVAESTDVTVKGLEKISHGINFQNLHTGLDKIESVLKSMFSHAVNIGKAIANWERGSSDWADTLITDAGMYGMDVETLQRWQHAQEIVDVGVDDIIKAYDKLNQKTHETKDTFASIVVGNTQYALKVRDANGALRNQTDVFWDFLDVLKQVDNETERNALAQEYFGKSFRELTGLYEKGREGWEKAASEATIVSEEDVNALGSLNDAYVSFDEKLAALSHTLAAQFAPAMEEVLGVLGVVSDKFMTWLQSDEGKEAVKNLSDAVVGLVGNLADINWEKIFQGATNAISSIAGFVSDITGDDIITGLEAIGGIIAGWEVSSKVLEVIAFFKAMGVGKKLGGLGGGAAGAGASGASGALVGGTGFTLAAATTAAITALVENERNNPGNGTLSKWRAAAPGSDAATVIIPNTYRLLTGENMTLPNTGTPATTTVTREQMEAAGIKMPTKPAQRMTEDELVDGVLSTFFGKEGGEVAEDVVESLTEGFAQAVADSVKAARMDKNYADLLDETPLTGELTEAGLKTIRDYTNAWLMAQQLHGGQGIDPDMMGAVNMDLVNQIWKNSFPEDFASQSGFGEALIGAAAQAGQDASAAFGQGAMENVQAAFAAGAALAAAFASGAASARPAGGGDTTNNFNSVGNVNVYGAQSPEQIAAAYNGYLADQNAGYGG